MTTMNTEDITKHMLNKRTNALLEIEKKTLALNKALEDETLTASKTMVLLRNHADEIEEIVANALVTGFRVETK